MDIESLKMETELKAAGYKYGINNEGYYSWTDPTGEIEITGTASAYQHLVKSRRYEDMEKLLKDIVSYEDKPYGFAKLKDSAIIQALILSAKAILDSTE